MVPAELSSDNFYFTYDDYLHAVCSICNENATVTYLEADPLAKIKLSCPRCGIAKTLQIYHSRGFPQRD
jgi:hypothetical protein